jgi:flagellar basal body L-ring protein FlgH
MDHPLCDASQAFQTGRIVQIALQRGDAASPQQTHTFGRRSQGHEAHTLTLRRTQLAGCAQSHIATAHDQDALAAKAGGQGAQGGLV